MQINGVEFQEERVDAGPHKRLYLISQSPLDLEEWLDRDLQAVVDLVSQEVDLAIYPLRRRVSRGKPVIPNIAPAWHWDESYEPRGDHHLVRVLANFYSENGRGSTDLVLHRDFMKELRRGKFLDRIMTGFPFKDEVLKLCTSNDPTKERVGINSLSATERDPAWEKVNKALKRAKVMRKFNWGENPDTAYLFANRQVVHRSGPVPIDQRHNTPQNLRGWTITDAPAGLVLN